jgi:hypothetical protein
MGSPNPVVVRLWMSRLFENEAKHAETGAERSRLHAVHEKARADALRLSGARSTVEWNRVKVYADRKYFQDKSRLHWVLRKLASYLSTRRFS